MIVFIGEEDEELEDVGNELVRIVDLSLLNRLQLLQHEAGKDLKTIDTDFVRMNYRYGKKNI
jgi:hypothetical protein